MVQSGAECWRDRRGCRQHDDQQDSMAAKGLQKVYVDSYNKNA
jgi:hypothetical protein